MTQPTNDLASIARELDVVASWHSGARGQKVRTLADSLWEQAGGRQETSAGDASLATRGPGVRSKTVADVVEVDSVGQIETAPQGGTEPVTPVVPTPNGVREQAEKAPKHQRGDAPQ